MRSNVIEKYGFLVGLHPDIPTILRVRQFARNQRPAPIGRHLIENLGLHQTGIVFEKYRCELMLYQAACKDRCEEHWFASGGRGWQRHFDKEGAIVVARDSAKAGV